MNPSLSHRDYSSSTRSGLLGTTLQLSGLAERVGFEPTVPFGTRLFESRTISHSDTSPNMQIVPEKV